MPLVDVCDEYSMTLGTYEIAVLSLFALRTFFLQLPLDTQYPLALVSLRHLSTSLLNLSLLSLELCNKES